MSDLRSIVVVPCATLIMLGCGNQIDHGKVETSIRDELKNSGVTLSSLTCPDKIPAKSGGTFQCTGADDQNTPATFDVTMTDDNGGISWKFAGTLIDMKKAGDSVESALSAGGTKKVDVTCPAKSMIAKKGCTFSCDATVDGKATKIGFTCSDDKGSVDYKEE